MRNITNLALVRLGVLCLVLGACGHGRNDEIRTQLGRFPGGEVFEDLERPGRLLGREVPPCLAFLAPAIGRGVCVPTGAVRPDGGRAARKWGRWTYEYVRTTEKTSPEGVLHTHFTDVEGNRLGIEARGEFEDNVIVGEWTFWHPNGTERALGSFAKGRMSGAWSFWLADGSPDATLSGVYEDDVRVSALPR